MYVRAVEQCAEWAERTVECIFSHLSLGHPGSSI